ncbi:MAG: hypothetical protein EHM20_11870 [Alphaproteobacteria bacterium]|nr:MAG: hypothetical protein EHM20_11870 [Alphaproteobacteria bacterium]
MLLPAKHIRLAESIIGLSGFVLEKLNKPKTVDLLWKELRHASENNEYPAYHSMENLLLSIDFLFLLDLVKLNENGEVFR